MKEARIIAICLCMCITSGAVVYWLQNKEKKDIAVIDAVRLVGGFNMKKELEEIARGKLLMRGRQIDSVNNLLRMATLSKNVDETKKLSYVLEYLRAKLEEEHEQSNEEISSQVWKRINPMMEKYGAKKGLHVIIGANGLGSVLYTDNYYDLTNDAIAYINMAYADGN